jgi:mono/diheme cytochrome c family protein/peroxiredoxin
MLAVAVVIVTGSLGWAIGKLKPGGLFSAASPTQTTADRGELLFQMHCSTCHGPNGHGDGPTILRPPPRDFASRPWRFDATPASIRKVILEGIPGTAMPAHRASLAPADIDTLVATVHAMALAQSQIVRAPTMEERLLRDNGFTDLGGTVPPDLKAFDAAGQMVRLADFKGHLVIIDFWGTGCVHCLTEMPRLREFEKSFSGRPLTVLYVCADGDDVNEAQGFADRVTSGVRALVETTGAGLARFEVQALPAVWLIGPDGKAIARTQGAKDWNAPSLRRMIEHWLPAS